MSILKFDTPHWLISAYEPATGLIPGQFSATGSKRVHN
jgi:hypothetical protein